VTLTLSTAALAVDNGRAFDDPVLNDRYFALIQEVRCLVCQNQSIADSNAALAADLRREIQSLLAQGKSDFDVADFLIARYGDFVMYRPPVKPLTWALWGGPGLLLAIGGLSFVRIMRRRAAAYASAGADS
jgi:cytochrome c-type biogenesis protein CcmH